MKYSLTNKQTGDGDGDHYLELMSTSQKDYEIEN